MVILILLDGLLAVLIWKSFVGKQPVRSEKMVWSKLCGVIAGSNKCDLDGCSLAKLDDHGLYLVGQGAGLDCKKDQSDNDLVEWSEYRTLQSSASIDACMKFGRWPITTIHGVVARSTASRSATSQFHC